MMRLRARSHENGTERNGTERNGTERNGTERNGTERNDMKLFQKTKRILTGAHKRTTRNVPFRSEKWTALNSEP